MGVAVFTTAASVYLTGCDTHAQCMPHNVLMRLCIKNDTHTHSHMQHVPYQQKYADLQPLPLVNVEISAAIQPPVPSVQYAGVVV